ncbi:MAG: DUF5752 family protein, partial [Candidatus Bathyarchaeia archaeon]
SRVRLVAVVANEPFLFYKSVGEENYTGVMAWSLKGMLKALRKVDVESLKFHCSRGDFESWARYSLRDEVLAEELKKIRLADLEGQELRKALSKVFRARLVKVLGLLEEATEYF